MKIAVFGGTGFVGSYIIDNLIENQFTPRILVRENSKKKIISAEKCEVVIGDIFDEEAIKEVLNGVDAVIYTIGLIREFPSLGITFEKLHFEGAVKCMDLSSEAGIKRFILMSANGVCPDGTGYQKTKWMSEQYLKNTDLDWTIFRPSTIFGDPRGQGRPEFFTQLKSDLIELPLPAPLFHQGLLPFNAGSFLMSPIHIKDVAQFFVKSIKGEKYYGKVFELGNENHTWKEMLRMLTSALNKNKLMIPAPIGPIMAVASILDRFSWFPATKDQLIMLAEGNTCDSSKLFSDFKIEPTPLNPDNLSYLVD
tara:strand:+ start:3289 stop:4215 length:927 start_codon:yes stop_codon:yes gene_type:complete